MSNEQRVSNEVIDKKLESFVEVMLQKMIDLHGEIKALKKKVHEQDKKLSALREAGGVDERIGIE